MMFFGALKASGWRWANRLRLLRMWTSCNFGRMNWQQRAGRGAMAGRGKGRVVEISADPAYFLDTHTWIFNATERAWIRFFSVVGPDGGLRCVTDGRHLIVLKRQLGLAWLCLGYALWLMLFRPAAVILLFSSVKMKRRVDE